MQDERKREAVKLVRGEASSGFVWLLVGGTVLMLFVLTYVATLVQLAS